MTTQDKDPFQTAVKYGSWLRYALVGSTGTGKTYTALQIATLLFPGAKVAFIDTEHKSASKYADIFKFKTLAIQKPFHPDKFMQAISDAVKHGYDVAVIDSLSHAWMGLGGVLSVKEGFAKQRQYNDFTAWRPAGKVQDLFIDFLLAAPIHLIVTMRSKMKHDMEEYTDEKGHTRRRVVRLGLAPQQQKEIEYEFDIVGDMNRSHQMEVTKTRCHHLDNAVIDKPGAELAATLWEWLQGEPEPEPEPAQASLNGGSDTGGEEDLEGYRKKIFAAETLTLGAVASFAVLTNRYESAQSALNAAKLCPHIPANISITKAQRVKNEKGLKIFDWLMVTRTEEAA